MEHFHLDGHNEMTCKMGNVRYCTVMGFVMQFQFRFYFITYNGCVCNYRNDIETKKGYAESLAGCALKLVKNVDSVFYQGRLDNDFVKRCNLQNFNRIIKTEVCLEYATPFMNGCLSYDHRFIDYLIWEDDYGKDFESALKYVDILESKYNVNVSKDDVEHLYYSNKQFLDAKIALKLVDSLTNQILKK
jgi:hypothetical protein